MIDILMLCGSTVSSVAADDLASKSQNPVGDLVSVPIQSNFNFGVGELDRMQNVNLLQPVAPFSLGPDWNLVVRPIFPIIYQPPLFRGDDTDFGLGDIQLQTYFVPKEAKQIPGGTFVWGAGPVLQARSATDERLGSGKWAAGVGGVVFFNQKPFTYGALVNNIWSFAGDSDRADVNLMTIQPFINYNMPDGWYLTSSPVMTANWEASDGNKWTVPLGGGFGRIFNIGDQPINAQIQAFGYAARPDGAPTGPYAPNGPSCFHNNRRPLSISAIERASPVAFPAHPEMLRLRYARSPRLLRQTRSHRRLPLGTAAHARQADGPTHPPAPARPRRTGTGQPRRQG